MQTEARRSRHLHMPLLVTIHGDGIGTGKTTLQLLLASFLLERGWRVRLASDDDSDARGMRLYDPALVTRLAEPGEATLLVSTTVLRSEQALPVFPCNTPRRPERPSAIRRFLGRLRLAAAVLCGAQPTGFPTAEQCWRLWKEPRSNEQPPSPSAWQAARPLSSQAGRSNANDSFGQPPKA